MFCLLYWKVFFKFDPNVFDLLLSNLFAYLVTISILSMCDALIYNNDLIKADELIETKTLQTMYKLRPVYFKQMPKVSIIQKDQGQFLASETKSKQPIKPVFYINLSCKEMIWLFMFTTMTFLTAISLWKIVVKLYSISVGVYKALKA